MSKKTLVSAITAALVVGAASTTFAAANPFSDVPADSWAYDAVSTLAADGVIDGYPDGTYKGQNTMTRYEMAQIVARAMAKTDIDKADKALVDKLAAEFAEELDNLGVRVADLEKKSDNVKWGGELRYRYWDADHDNGSDSTYNRVMFRLTPKAYIGESGWTANARINYSLDMGSANNAGFDPTDNDASVDLAYVEGPLFGGTVQAGRLSAFTATGLVFDDRINGVQYKGGSDVFQTTLTAGRYRNDLAESWANGTNIGSMFVNTPNSDITSDFYGIQFDYTPNDKLALNAGYNALTGLEADTLNASYGNDTDAQIWYVGGKYAFNSSLALNAEYAQNTSADEDDDAWRATLNYKGADVADAGSWGMYAGYADLGVNSVPAPTYDDVAGGQKGFVAGVQYVPAENILATVQYFTGEDSYVENGDNDAEKIFSQIEFFF
ncbi:S-layer homology domain-containing protein [Megamonas hypermegale]|uniref:S-layer homology domain-containing protein n=1 Tax=Megamonas hypermegale TaxID=158847 RepID=UPI0026EEE2DA|nr:S-layer homology domain-containing protein [Megamonas hypermegale]